MRRLLAVALATGLLVAVPVLGKGPSFQDLEESLTCQCGCGLTVHSCNHLQCPSAIPLRQEIRDQMSLGKDKEPILTYFADKYGEKILSSPTTTGFNLTAWVMPFFVLSLGAIFVVLTLLRWRRAPRTAAGPVAIGAPPPATAARSAHEEILERELSQYEP